MFACVVVVAEGKSQAQRWRIVRIKLNTKAERNDAGREWMKKGRKEILRGEERFLKALKNDGNGGGGGEEGVPYWNREPSRSWLADAVPARQAECNVWLAWPHLGPVFGQGRHTHPHIHTQSHTHPITKKHKELKCHFLHKSQRRRCVQ